MAQIFVSPGVYTQEIDESFVPAGAGAIGAALVGLTEKGPAFLPLEVGSFGEFREIFGSMKENLHVPYAARAYLKNAGTLNVVRVLGRGTASVGTACILSFPPATTAGSVTGVSGATAAVSASNNVLGILRLRGDVEQVMLSGSPSNFDIAIPGKGVTAQALSLNEASGNYVKKVLGTDPVNVKSGDSLTALYVDAVFDYHFSTVTGSVSGAGVDATFSTCTADSTQITGGFTPARSTMVVSQNFGGTVYDLFRVFTRSDGDAANNSTKISITQVDTAATANAKFTVVVRTGNDSDEMPQILESFTDLDLDPSSKQYIGRVIGDRRPVYDLTQNPPEILFDGDYPNKSNFVYVRVEDGFPANARPAGFKGYSKIVPGPYIPALPTITNQLNTRNEVDSGLFLGVNFGAGSGGIFDRLKSTTVAASASTSADQGFLIYAVSGDQTNSATVTAYASIDMVGSNSGNFNTTNKVRFSFPVYKGFDGLDPRSNKFVDVNDGTLSADFYKAIDTLANSDEIDINLLASPGVHSSSVGNIPQKMIDVATSRGDTFVIADLSNGTTTAAALNLSVANAQTEADKYDSNYGAAYYPWVRINDIDNDKIVWVPPTVEVMGAIAFNDRIAQPWFAPAGVTRGGLENVLEVRRRLTQGQRDDLQNKNINPIATFPNIGIVIWGQQTLQKKQSLLDRVNVRRMMLEVRKTIAGFSRVFVFDPNTVTLRSKLLERINSYLGQVQAAQGLQEFRAVLDETTTTPDLIDRNIVKGKIFLKPTTAAEVILLDFAVTSSGAVFSE